MLNSKKEDFLNYLKGKNLLIATHDSTDLDGFVSALALKFFFENFFTNQNIFLTFSKLSKYTKNFVVKFLQKFPDFNFPSKNDENFSNIDVIVIVDSNNLEQIKLSNMLNLDVPFIFVDHHLDLKKNYGGNIASLNLIFENYSSTAEIILELINNYNFDIPIPYKYLLISAILTDSGFLKYGNTETIKHLFNILKDEIEFQDVLLLLENETDISKKIASIKGLQRAKLIRVDSWLIGISHVSSFSASVASTLIKVGYDVGIVYTKEKSKYRISARAKKNVCLKTGLHLGNILNGISNVDGGGHDGAATLNGENDLERNLNEIIDTIKRTLINYQPL